MVGSVGPRVVHEKRRTRVYTSAWGSVLHFRTSFLVEQEVKREGKRGKKEGWVTSRCVPILESQKDPLNNRFPTETGIN